MDGFLAVEQVNNIENDLPSQAAHTTGEGSQDLQCRRQRKRNAQRTDRPFTRTAHFIVNAVLHQYARKRRNPLQQVA